KRAASFLGRRLPIVSTLDSFLSASQGSCPPPPQNTTTPLSTALTLSRSIATQLKKDSACSLWTTYSRPAEPQKLRRCWRSLSADRSPALVLWWSSTSLTHAKS